MAAARRGRPAVLRRRRWRIVSWNVNGLRAACRKGFRAWLDAQHDAVVVGLQETRVGHDQLPGELAELDGWHLHLTPAARKGYSGVGLLSRLPPDSLDTSLGERRFDDEGRLQIARFGALLVVNAYFPNGKGKERDNSRVPFKLDFYAKLRVKLQRARRRGARVLVIGDFNTAHRAIDLARPEANRRTSGFLPEECAEIDRWLAAGWVDAFRHFEDGPGHYTWWTQRANARERNVGWRIDYVLACSEAMHFVRAASIHAGVHGSDHCPIDVVVDRAITDPDA